MKKKVLMIAAGNSRARLVREDKEPPLYTDDCDVVALDINPNCGADLLWDMENRPLPFFDNSFDEIAAFNCLEHWGKCGSFRDWFDECSEYHRLLKPGGKMKILVPLGEDRFADPGHTRFFSINHFAFLNQQFYERALQEKQPVTDYRWLWTKNFDIEWYAKFNDPPSHLGVILVKA